MRKSEFFVIKVGQCDTCKGAGVIQHPDWRDYWEKYRERFPHGPRQTATGLLAEQDFHDDFWRSRGYDYREPPEEIECPDCDGKGTLESKVPLAEALAALRELAEGVRECGYE